jgi:hypothetical protein
MGQRSEPHSCFIVGLRLDEDGFLEIAQPAELLEIELTDDGPLTMRQVQIGEPDDYMGLGKLASELDVDFF